MTSTDILRKHPAFHRGYQPQSIGVTTLEPKGCGFLKRLRSVPGKVTAYFDRAKLSEVYKTRFGGLDGEYYILRATDGTLFHVEY